MQARADGSAGEDGAAGWRAPWPGARLAWVRRARAEACQSPQGDLADPLRPRLAPASQDAGGESVFGPSSPRRFNTQRPAGSPHGRRRFDAKPCDNPWCDRMCDRGGSRRREKGGLTLCWACRHGLRRLLRGQPEGFPEDEVRLASRAVAVQRAALEQGTDPYDDAVYTTLLGALHAAQRRRERLAEVERRAAATNRPVVLYEATCLACARSPRDAGVGEGQPLPPRCPRCGGTWWLSRVRPDEDEEAERW